VLHSPNFEHEQELITQGYCLIAGIDEVGRGSLAGPVAAAAVILPTTFDSPWMGEIRDSKLLSPAKREYLSPLIKQIAVSVGIAMIPSEEIDSSNIVEATKQAMCQAVNLLKESPDFLLIDFMKLPTVYIPQQGIVHGDRISLSIACASIVAKVARDHYMMGMDEQYPGYEFSRHKGYGTKYHRECIRKHGPCEIHRRSFLKRLL